VPVAVGSDPPSDTGRNLPVSETAVEGMKKYYLVSSIGPAGMVISERFMADQRDGAIRHVWETRFHEYPGQAFTVYEADDGNIYIDPGIDAC
jgi:hypothetical protein